MFPLWISFHLEISLIWKLKLFATTRLRIDFHSRPKQPNPNSSWIWRYAGTTSVFQFSYFPPPSLSLSFFLPAGWAKSARNVNYLICLLPRPPLKIVRCTFDKHLWRPVAMWKVQHFLHVHISTWTPLQRGVPKKRKATLMNCWFCWRQHKSSQYYRVRKVNRVCHLLFVSQHILYGKKVKLMILRLLGKQGKWWQ